MNDLLFIIYTLFIYFTIIAFLMYLPKLTRKSIYFSVRIPVDKIENKELKDIYNKYRAKVLIILIPIALFTAIFIDPNSEYLLYSFSISTLIIVSFILFFNARKSVMILKEENKWLLNKKNIVYVETENNTIENNVSSKWFLLSILIIIFNVIYVKINYLKLPSQIPTNWDSYGNITSTITKTPFNVLILPGTQIFMVLMMFFVYKSIQMSKNQIDVEDPENSKIRNHLFKKRWSVIMLLMLFILQFLFTILTVKTVNPEILSGVMLTIIISLSTFSILALTIGNAFLTGQGGRKIKVKGSIQTEEVEYDDDKFWKLGLFYVNKNDSSIFVEKRFGVGFTINFGNPIGIAILVTLIVVIIFFAVISI